MATKVIMPQLGESVVEGTVTKWLKREGEAIGELESLLEVNTDKVDTEIPSPAGGTLLKIVIPEGTTVQAGTVLAWIGSPDEVIPGGVPQPGRPLVVDKAEGGNGHGREAEAPAAGGRTPAAGRDRDLGFISPVVARLAQENHLDLAKVHGTGANGRITKGDVLDYLEQHKAAPAEETPAWETPADGDLFRPTEMVFGAERKKEEPVKKPAPAPVAPAPSVQIEEAGDLLIPLNPVRKAIAEHMVASKHTSPHVSTVMEADLSRVVAHLEANRAAFARDGARLTYTAYFLAASVAALKAFPVVNSSWSDAGIQVHRAINIGMATSLGDEGLIVPVIKGADGLSLLGLARAINDLADRARSHRLKPEEVKGGTFTITNHGISGSLFATPVINQPQCAILGVGAVQKRVVVILDAIAIRPMVYLSLTFDHRILDGASADHFLAKVVETLQNWV